MGDRRRRSGGAGGGAGRQGGGRGGRSPGRRTLTQELAGAYRRRAVRSRVVRARPADQRGKSFDWVGEAGPLRGKTKGPKYEGEDERFGWRHRGKPGQLPADSKGWVTHYDRTPEERRASAVDIADDGELRTMPGTLEGQGGWVIDPETGTMHTFRPDRIDATHRETGQERTHFGLERPGSLVRTGHDIESFHHTSPLAGGEVAGAGTYEAKDGALTHLTDASGHYTPEAEYTHQAVAHLEASGARLRHGPPEEQRSMRVSLTGYDRFQGAGKAWISEENRRIAESSGSFAGQMDEDTLTLLYEQFLTSHGNERQIRLKKTLNKELEEKQPRRPADVESSDGDGGAVDGEGENPLEDQGGFAASAYYDEDESPLEDQGGAAESAYYDEDENPL